MLRWDFDPFGAEEAGRTGVEGKQHLGGRRTGGTLLLMIQKSVFYTSLMVSCISTGEILLAGFLNQQFFVPIFLTSKMFLVVWKKTTFLVMECLGGPVNFQTTPPWTSG